MSAIDHLVEQRILESESHLRHIDELLAKARGNAALAPQTATQLSRFEQDHERLTREVDALRKSPAPDADERSKGLKAVLQTLGLELEKTLTAIGDKPDH